MKIKRTNKINQKILELHLLKLRTYEQYNEKIDNIINIDVNQTLINLKKALRIIFKYNKKNKKILFLGFNGLIVKKINKETKHIAIPLTLKLQGLISNQVQLENKTKYSLPKLRTKPDLILILDQIDKYESILKESYSAKIPTITFGHTFKIRMNNVFLYNIPANMEFLLYNKKFFYNCLKFLFKKNIHKKNEKNKI